MLLNVLSFSSHIFTFAFICNLFAKLYKLNQGRGDYNAKLGVTILGTFLNVISILCLIYLREMLTSALLNIEINS